MQKTHEKTPASTAAFLQKEQLIFVKNDGTHASSHRRPLANNEVN